MATAAAPNRRAAATSAAYASTTDASFRWWRCIRRTLRADATFEDAVAIMAERYVAHLLAHDASSGCPVGVVSSFDVATVLGGSEPGPARTQRRAPAGPRSSAGTLSEALVRDVMRHGVIAVTPDVTVSVVARAMADYHVHCVAVVGVDHTQGRGHHLTWGFDR
jgi:CBS domain-containing protein